MTPGQSGDPKKKHLWESVLPHLRPTRSSAMLRKFRTDWARVPAAVVQRGGGLWKEDSMGKLAETVRFKGPRGIFIKPNCEAGSIDSHSIHQSNSQYKTQDSAVFLRGVKQLPKKTSFWCIVWGYEHTMIKQGGSLYYQPKRCTMKRAISLSLKIPRKIQIVLM